MRETIGYPHLHTNFIICLQNKVDASKELELNSCLKLNKCQFTWWSLELSVSLSVRLFVYLFAHCRGLMPNQTEFANSAKTIFLFRDCIPKLMSLIESDMNCSRADEEG